MILTVFMHGRSHHPTSWRETERLITEVVENLPDPEPRPAPEPLPEPAAEGLVKVLASLPEPRRPYGGMTAEFIFADRRWNPDDAAARLHSYLHVAVNARTGYGALIWLVTRDFPMQTDARIADHVWISDNPAPPVVDPGVIADPGLPRYHQPRSTLPVARVRAAVEEFCRTGTGHRPSRVDWAMGHLGGRRLDTPVREEHIPRCADPWCEVLEPGHLAHGG